MLDLTTGKIVKVPIETKSQAECLAYAQQLLPELTGPLQRKAASK
jgi:hypothetical protein